MTSSNAHKQKKGKGPDAASVRKSEDITLDLNTILRATLEATDNGILVVDDDGRIITHNQQFATMWGIPESILKSRDDQQLIQSILDQLTDPDAFLERVRTLYGSNDSSDDLIEFKDGKIFQRHSEPLLLNDRNIGRVWSFRDISEQKRVEKELKDSEIRFRTLTENLRDTVWAMDADLNYIYVSPTVEKMRGFTAEEVIEMSSDAQLSEPSQKRIDLLKEGVLNRIKQGERVDILLSEELELMKKDGSYLPVEVNAHPVYDANDRFEFILGTTRDLTERKRAESEIRKLNQELEEKVRTRTEELNRSVKELQVSEKKFRRLFNEAIDSIFVVDFKTGKIIDCNKNACKLIERDRQAIVGMNQRDLYPAGEYLRYKALLPSSESEVRRELVEGHVITAGGDFRNVLIKASLLSTESGKMIQWIFRDVTDRRKTERELKRIETEKNLFFDLSVDMMCIAGFDGYFKQINPAWTQVLGWDESDLLTNPWLDFVHPDDIERTRNADQQIWDGKTVSRFENRYRCKDGSYKWFSWNSQPLEEIGLIYAVARDITPAKLYQEKLRESERFLSEAQRIARIGNWIWDLTQGALTWSDQVFQIFGLSKENVTPSYEGFLESIHPDDRKKVNAAVEKALNDFKSYSVDHRILMPDGSLRHVQERGEVFLDDNGQPAKMIGTVQDITERVLIENQVKEVLEMNDKIITTSTFGILVYNDRGDCILSNDSAATIVGATKAQVLSQNFRKIPSWKETGILELAEKAIRTQSEQYKEIRVLTSFGAEKWLSCKFNVFKSNAKDHLLLIFEDISDRKQSEEILKSAIQFNQLLGVSTVEEIIEFGLEEAVRLSFSEIGYFHFVNTDQKTIALTAWSRATMEWCDVGEKATHYPIDQAGIWVDCIRQGKAVIHNDYETAEGKKGLPEGHTPLYRDMAIPLFDGDKIIAVIGVGNKPSNYTDNDIDQLSFLSEHMINTIQRLRAENELSNTHKRLSLATRSADIGIWDWDVVNNKLIWDEEMYRLYGVAEEDFDGAYDAWVKGVHPDDIGQAQEEVRLALEGLREFDSEFRIVLPDQTIRHIKAYADVYRTPGGKAERMVGLNWDISTLKEAQLGLIEAKEIAEKANRAKSEFLANMSHEIRTPLNAIIGFSELLTQLNVNEKTTDYASSIQVAGKSLLTIINDILDMSKIEAGMIEMSYQAVDLRRLFSEIEQMFRQGAEAKGLHFQIDIAEELPQYLSLDEIRLRQVLFNIVGNGIKFTKKGHVKVRVVQRSIDDTSQQDLSITVEDTGIGIPKPDLKHIFVPFKQQSGHITRTFGGTGLGLTISKKLVEMMDGEILVESVPGEGSVFEVRLNNVESVAKKVKAVAAEVRDVATTRFETADVLIVDDIPSNRKMLISAMKEMGLRVHEAENGREAIEKTRQIMPKLILMDIRMPVMDGFEASRRIKADEMLKDIPVIALTASTGKLDVEKIDASSLDGYLVKPVSFSELIAEIAKYLKLQSGKEDPGDRSAVESNLDILDDAERDAIRKLIESQHIDAILLEQLKKMKAIKPGVIKTFIKEMRSAGETNQIDSLLRFSDNLASALDSYNLERVKGLVQQFIEYIDKT